jgi:hypothetical protein
MDLGLSSWIWTPSETSVMKWSSNMQYYSTRRHIPEYGLSSFILNMDSLRNVGYEVKLKHAVVFSTALFPNWFYDKSPHDRSPLRYRMLRKWPRHSCGFWERNTYASVVVCT